GMNPNGDDQPVGKSHGLAHHVEMTVGDRVERPCIEGGSRHKRGSNPPPDGPQGHDLRALNLFPGRGDHALGLLRLPSEGKLRRVVLAVSTLLIWAPCVLAQDY